MEEIIKNIVRKCWKEIKKKPNVVGYSGKLRNRIKDGKEIPGTSVFRVYVSKKDRTLGPDEMVPRTLDICTCGIPVETDVVEIGTIRYMDDITPEDCRKRRRPVQAGVSGTSINSTACTLNVLYRRPYSNGYKVYISTCNHCLGRENDAPIGELLVQPSPYDGGTVLDVIGSLAFRVETKYSVFRCVFRRTLLRLWKLLTLTSIRGTENVNTVDVCFADVDPGSVTGGIFGENGKIVGKATHDIGKTVYKTGRTTGKTSGTIIDDSWSGIVAGRRGNAMYTDCVLTTVPCQGGDSGSPVYSYDASGDILYNGVLFAGSDTTMVYCKWENVEKEADVEVVIS